MSADTWKNFANLAALSMHCYTDSKNANQALKFSRIDLKKAQFIKSSRCQGWLFFTKNKKLIIAVRGTRKKDQGDWSVNLNFRCIDHPRAGCVHMGYFTQAQELYGELRKHLLDFHHVYHDIQLTGHSMGGAVAQHLSEFLILDGFPVSQCCTFGQPRIGDAKFANYYDSVLKINLHRFVNQNDIVPRLPFVWQGFQHCGKLYYIGHGGEITDMTLPQQLNDLARGVTNAIRRRDSLDFYYDHDIRHYVYYLRRQARKK